MFEPDPYNYEGLDAYYTLDIGLADGMACATAPHSNLQGLGRNALIPAPSDFFCVVSGSEVYGPYLTQNAAQSLVDEGIEGQIVPMTLR